MGVGIDVEGVASRGALPLAPLDPHFLDPVLGLAFELSALAPGTAR